MSKQFILITHRDVSVWKITVGYMKNVLGIIIVIVSGWKPG